MKRIAVLGEMGTGNLGDDYSYILLRDELIAAFRELDEEVNIYPLSGEAGLDMATWHAVVTGCGTLLDEVRGNYVHRLLLADCPIAILGTGTADPRYANPTREGKWALRNALKIASYTWRRGVAGPDTGWLAGWRRDESWPSAEGDLCAINDGPAAHNLLPVTPEMLQQVRALLKRKSTLIAAFPNDLPQLQPLQQGGESVLFVDGSAASFAQLARCSTVFCLRIHLAVFAACCGVHPILLDYSGKVRQVFAGTEVPHTILDSVTPAAIAAALDGAAPVSREAVETAQRECKAHVRKAVAAIVADWAADGA
jgi:hypothetical protein